MQTESAIKSKTIAALKIPEKFEALLGEIKNGVEIKISRGGVVIAGMIPEPVAAKKRHRHPRQTLMEEAKQFSASRPANLFPNTWMKAGKSDFGRIFRYQRADQALLSGSVMMFI